MRILILGASGMLGHKLVLKLSEKYQVSATLRQKIPAFFKNQSLPNVNFIEDTDVFQNGTIEAAIARARPDYVLNCIGVVKQLAAAKDPVISISVNALFPHQLEKLADIHKFRLISFSTDCVFSGKGGPYRQSDPSDVNDLYGMTKFLGEVTGRNALTLRTSIVGREFTNRTGLVEWLLAQRNGRVNGYRRALYTGLTTNAMADLIDLILTERPNLHGLYQVASQEISKFELLGLVKEFAAIDVDIAEDNEFFCDRRLIGAEFCEATGWRPDPWPVMIKKMFDEDRRYYTTTAERL